MYLKYRQKPEEKLKADFSRRKRKGLNDFENFHAFKNWYDLQEKVCHYCGLKEEESQEIVLTGVLKSNRFPQNGILGRGKSRGMWLEIDRLNPKESYSTKNCVLSCYFCNNDKSDVFDGKAYKEFRNDRVGFLKRLLVKSKNQKE